MMSLIFILKMNGQYNVNIDSLPKQELPTWFIHNGDTVGLIFNIQQVQKIDSDLDKKFVYWKERFEFVFVLLMAILLIYLFNPRRKEMVMIDGETKVLFYLFGFVLIITADWSVFFREAKWFKYLQGDVGEEGTK